MARQGANKANRRILLLAVLMMGGMTGLVSYAPTLYTMFCSLTGFGGAVNRAAAPAAQAATAVPDTPVTVWFDSNVAPDLDWNFYPEQRKVVTKFGEPTKAWYVAHNNTDHTVVARAVFNVTPYKAAPYFFKIECFCFTEEKLAPGESARMPLVLYVDQELLNDPETQEVRDITLSYTFTLQDSDPEDIAAARDLKGGSEDLAKDLKQQENVEFENDAPRR
jgi:cytochrome c oxidase assembly protein subunit 11